MCASLSPGMTVRLPASMTRVAGPRQDARSVSLPTAAIVSPLIASAVAKGILETGRRHWLVELDRAAAIAAAIRAAKPGDVVVVAGKGHETYQEVAGERRPYADAHAVDDALAGRSAA